MKACYQVVALRPGSDCTKAECRASVPSPTIGVHPGGTGTTTEIPFCCPLSQALTAIEIPWSTPGSTPVIPSLVRLQTPRRGGSLILHKGWTSPGLGSSAFVRQTTALGSDTIDDKPCAEQVRRCSAAGSWLQRPDQVLGLLQLMCYNSTGL